MKYLTQLLTALLFCSLVSLELHADTWTDSTGKFKIEAEFVQLSDGKVQLKKDEDGSLIWVPLEKLSSADQEKAKRMAAAKMETGSSSEEPAADGRPVPKTDPDELAKQVKVTGKIQWSEFPSFDQDGKETGRDLYLKIIATGKPAQEALQFGFVKVKTLTSKTGEKIKVGEDRMAMSDPAKSYDRVDRDFNMFDQHPKNGVGIMIPLAVNGNLEQLTVAEGTFRLLTGGKRDQVIVEDVKQQLGKKIDSAVLKELGLNVSVDAGESFGSYGIEVKVAGDIKQLVSLRLLDKNGEDPDIVQGSGRSSTDRIMQMSFQLSSDEVPEGIRLEIKTVKDPVEIELPFDLKDLKVPKKPTQPSFGDFG